VSKIEQIAHLGGGIFLWDARVRGENMTTTELEKEEHFREAVRRLEAARALPSQKVRRAEREVAAELLTLAEAVFRS
jgi:hypothetical protein